MAKALEETGAGLHCQLHRLNSIFGRHLYVMQYATSRSGSRCDDDFVGRSQQLFQRKSIVVVIVEVVVLEDKNMKRGYKE
jgi:hypothetical protein